LTPQSFGFWGKITPEWKLFINYCPNSALISPTIHVSRPNLAKIGRCEVAEKSSGIADKKDTRPGHFLASISPPLNRSRPRFRERCRPFTWACVPTLVRIGCGLPNLFRKVSKNSNTTAYKNNSRVCWFEGKTAFV